MYFKRKKELNKLHTIKTRSNNIASLSNKVSHIKAPHINDNELLKQQQNEANVNQQLAAYGASKEEATDDRNFVEKALNLKSHQGFFGDVFEVLGRPQQAAAGAILNKNPVVGAFKGFTGNERHTGEELGKAFGVVSEKTPNWWNHLAGFGMDIATDPLSWTNKPFEVAGKAIKSMSSKGYGIARNALMKTERGRKVIQSLEQGMDRISNVTKSAFGLWKDKEYTNFKNHSLNQVNQRLTQTSHVANNITDVKKAVESYVKDLHMNPDKFSEDIKSLGLTKESTEEEIRKRVNEEMMNHLESTKKDNLTKQQIYNNLAKPTNDGDGRFFIASQETGEEQAKGIMDAIKEDYYNATGEEISPEEMSFTNGFINIKPNIRAFLNRELKAMERINKRVAAFGDLGKVEGALKTLGDTGVVTFDLSDPAERAIVAEINRNFGGRKIVEVGTGHAKVVLTQKEFAKLQDTDLYKDILSNTKQMGTIRRKQETLKKRIGEYEGLKLNANIRHNERLQKLSKEHENYVIEMNNLKEERDVLDKEIEDLAKESKMNQDVVDSPNKPLSSEGGHSRAVGMPNGRGKKWLQKSIDKTYFSVLGKMPGLRNVFSEEELQSIISQYYVHLDNQALALVRPGGVKVNVKDIKGQNNAFYQSEMLFNENIKKYMERYPLQNTFTHELLHAIDNALGAKLLPKSTFKNGETRTKIIGFGRNGKITERIPYADVLKWQNSLTSATSLSHDTSVIRHLISHMVNDPESWKKEIESLMRDVNNNAVQGSKWRDIDVEWESEDYKKFIKQYQEVTDNFVIKSHKLEQNQKRYINFTKMADFKNKEDLIEFAKFSGIYNKETALKMGRINKKGFNELRNFVEDSIAENEAWRTGISDITKPLKEQLLKRQIHAFSQNRASVITDRDIFQEFLEKNSEITSQIARNIESVSVVLTSGAIDEYFAEIGSKVLNNVIKKENERYTTFFHDFMDKKLGIKINPKRDIVFEKREATKRFNKIIRRGETLDRRILNINKKFVDVEERFANEMLKYNGSQLTYKEYLKELNKGAGWKKKTLKRIEKSLDESIPKYPSNEEIADYITAPSKKKLNAVETINPNVQKDISNFNELVKRWKVFEDDSFYKVKMADSIYYKMSERFKEIVNSQEATKQQIYKMIGDIYAQEGTDLGKVLKNLNADGYMRHVANPDVMIYKELQRLKNGGKFNGLEVNKIISKLGDANAKFLEKNWLGSATDINKTLGTEIFNADPIESMAVLLKLLPEHFEINNLMQNAFDSNLIATISEKDSKQIISDIEKLTKEGMTIGQARREAFRKFMPKEYTLINSEVKRKLKDSFEFLRGGGAKGEEMKAFDGKTWWITGIPRDDYA